MLTVTVEQEVLGTDSTWIGLNETSEKVCQPWGW